MSRNPDDSFIAVFRKICGNELVWPKPYGPTQAWLWLCMHAKSADTPEVKRGQLVKSKRELAEAWGWEVKDRKSGKTVPDVGRVRRFLDSLQQAPDGPMVNVEAIAIPEYIKESPKKPKKKPKFPPKTSRITVLLYEEYQTPVVKKEPKKKPKSTPKTTEPKEEKACKETIEKTDNSVVFDFYIAKRRELLGLPEWLPSANQAITMRTNIKKMLETHSSDDLVGMLKRFFADDKLRKNKWPWTFFATDPVQWAKDANVIARDARLPKPEDWGGFTLDS